MQKTALALAMMAAASAVSAASASAIDVRPMDDASAAPQGGFAIVGGGSAELALG